MTRFQELLLNVSLFLSMVTLIKARITVNKCQDSSPKASCRQKCYEDCKMSCGQADPQLKSCEQTCLDHGQCDFWNALPRRPVIRTVKRCWLVDQYFAKQPTALNAAMKEYATWVVERLLAVNSCVMQDRVTLNVPKLVRDVNRWVWEHFNLV